MAQAGRKPGKPKTGGRKAGTPNKITKTVRDMIAMLVESRWDDVLAAFDSIEKPRDKCEVIIGLLPFVAPKMSAIEYKGDVPVKTLADELDEISGEKTRK